MSAERRLQVLRIRHVLSFSDESLHALYVKLDGFERAARRDPGADVSAAWLHTLDQIHDELIRAATRLGHLNSPLRAKVELRRALLNRAAGFAAWRRLLTSTTAGAVKAAQADMEAAFTAAATHAELGVDRLDRGV